MAALTLVYAMPAVAATPEVPPTGTAKPADSAKSAKKSAKAAAAERPEGRDAAVKKCAEVASRRLAGGGFDGARTDAVTPRHPDSCILRWEQAFSATDATKVATLVVVPVDVQIVGANNAHRATTLRARCGFTDGKMRAFELLEKDVPC
jgi:hypothetical protein